MIGNGTEIMEYKSEMFDMGKSVSFEYIRENGDL